MSIRESSCWRVLLKLSLVCLGASLSHGYLLGTGKADITGPAADVELMGYASPTQVASGIHIRLYARAFLVADENDDRKRFIFVNLDACMAAQAITLGVHRKLKERFGDLYTEDNVAISGTHTHSGPAGYLQYVLYQITSLGFVKQSWQALVDGAFEAIVEAHSSVRPGRLEVAAGELLEANINRSPTSYLENPAEERARYKHDIDKNMTLLHLTESDGRSRGAVTWFPVHCTSINNTNSLISGDNKGTAAQLLEKWGSENGSSPFIAAFGQANVGDTSPNTQGAFCLDTNEPCQKEHSTCNGRNELCIGRGPAWDADDFGYQSNEIIARKQFGKAMDLLEGDLMSISGPIDYRHSFIDMTNIEVLASNWTTLGKTCKPAMGFGFAAGTTDGPGAFDFKQGDTKGTVFWRLVSSFIRSPTEEQAECQRPKQILLDTGEINIPYAWQPSIVDVQILRVGQFVILAVPGELTTMAGRRLREAIYDQVAAEWGADVTIVIAGLSNTYTGYVTTPEEYDVQRFEAAATAYGRHTLGAYIQVAGEWGHDVVVVIAGLSNTYSSYVATREEYQAQRYEGSSTIFGQHTLDAYIQEFSKLAQAMLHNEPVAAGPRPPYLVDQQWGLLPPVVIDTVPGGAEFGGIITDVPAGEYVAGERVSATFHAGCPRNNLRTNDTFLTVERKDSSGWTVVHTDADLSTKFDWKRPHMLSSLSASTIIWRIPEGTPSGTYRIQHFGNHKHLTGDILPYSGVSREFQVAASPAERERARSQLGMMSSIWRWSNQALVLL